MAHAKTILVTEATGKQGGAVARAARLRGRVLWPNEAAAT